MTNEGRKHYVVKKMRFNTEKGVLQQHTIVLKGLKYNTKAKQMFIVKLCMNFIVLVGLVFVYFRFDRRALTRQLSLS